ncbi:unnamed protein product [Brassica rapa subsp. trilocularis]
MYLAVHGCISLVIQTSLQASLKFVPIGFGSESKKHITN